MPDTEIPTIIGLGGAACKIVDQYARYPEYDLLKIDSDPISVESNLVPFHFIDKQNNPEDY